MNYWIAYNGGNVINALLLGYFASKTHGRKTGRLLYAFVTLVIMGIILPMLSTEYLPQTLSTIAAITSFLAYFIFLFKDSIKSKLLSFVVTFAVMTVVEALAFYTVGLMSIDNATANSLIYLLLFSIMCFPALLLLSRIWNSIDFVRSNPQSIMFLPISQFAMAFLLMSIMTHNPVSGVDIADELLTNRIFSAALVAVMSVSLIADAMFLKGFEKTATGIREREQLRSLQTENELTLNYIQAMKSDVDEMHRYRHDMLNIMTALKLALGEDSESGRSTAVSLIDELTDKISGLKAAQYSRCVIVNCVLSFEEELMRRDGIACELKADVPESICVNELDLCRIMINILDNARESCCRIADRERRTIRFNMNVDGEYLYIACANTRPDGELRLESEKDDKENHGYGLKIIRELAEKNGGTAVIEAVEDEVKVIVNMRTDH